MSFKERMEKIAEGNKKLMHLPQFRAALSLRGKVRKAMEAHIADQGWGLSAEEAEHLASIAESKAHKEFVAKLSPRSPRVPLADAAFLEMFTIDAQVVLSQMVDSGEAEAIVASLREEEGDPELRKHGIQ